MRTIVKFGFPVAFGLSLRLSVDARWAVMVWCTSALLLVLLILTDERVMRRVVIIGRRHRIMLTLVACVVGAVAGGAFWQAYLRAQPRSTSPFARLSSLELKQKVMMLTGQIRVLRERYQGLSNKLMADYRSSHAPPVATLSPEDQRRDNQEWLAHGEATGELYRQEMAEYVRFYKGDTVTLRDELRQRLPDYKPAQTGIDRMYRQQHNMVVVGMIVEDLETMAGQLAP